MSLWFGGCLHVREGFPRGLFNEFGLWLDRLRLARADFVLFLFRPKLVDELLCVAETQSARWPLNTEKSNHTPCISLIYPTVVLLCVIFPLDEIPHATLCHGGYAYGP